jgi:hypothetical protein
MSWTTVLSNQLKYVLDDTNNDDYDNIRLSKFIAIAATIVFSDLNLINFTVDTEEPSIVPDPTTEKFAPLLVLKAAELVIRQEYKKMSRQAGIKITDDRSSIDGSNYLNALKELMNGYKKQYEDAKKSYQLGAGNIGQAILGPYTP